MNRKSSLDLAQTGFLMSAPTPVMRTLERAAESLGGISLLAAKLGVSIAEVERWIAGIPPPPAARIYISALDIVSGIDR